MISKFNLHNLCTFHSCISKDKKVGHLSEYRSSDIKIQFYISNCSHGPSCMAVIKRQESRLHHQNLGQLISKFNFTSKKMCTWSKFNSCTSRDKKAGHLSKSMSAIKHLKLCTWFKFHGNTLKDKKVSHRVRFGMTKI
jgi:hypothetical protein